jgi:ABC-type lipoprotein export system ATPase subunit
MFVRSQASGHARPNHVPTESLMQMFGELHAEDTTICVATHDPRWYRQSQRTIYLFDGRVVQEPQTSSP